MNQNSTQFDKVILVDEQDRAIGSMNKIPAHELGLLHRAFSIFIYRHTPQSLEFLLQKRGKTKYHCPGLWTNTCCSHPRPEETILIAAQRRLKEEMSLEIELKSVGSFIYRASFENGLTEHELDHVLIGEFKGTDSIQIDTQEVEDFQWITWDALQKDLILHPMRYTPWIGQALQIVLKTLETI